MRGFATGAQKVSESGGTVDVNISGRATEFAGGKETGQSEKVVAVKVCNEDAADLRDAQGAAQDLVLRAFAAIEQPDFRALRQA